MVAAPILPLRSLGSGLCQQMACQPGVPLNIARDVPLIPVGKRLNRSSWRG